ncbi:MAG TPA: gliding motility-associated ABC transporter ATP-binding subunit GldA [Chitinophagaceae bacterium]|nr:gliding motility-associated ABC transporter ATP-binding subunit GldA [Chitinophagaceae bacterium]
MSIEVSVLTKVYGEQKAVNNLSFKVAKGEIVGFLGPNGAGKSTTMKILTGYLQQDSGSAMVCGLDVKNNQIETKKRIGYLPEANPLYYDMYVREYLDFIAGAHNLRDRKTKIDEVIGLTGLGSESKKKTGQLSKGYKQRVGLAAALIHNPEVLILDEPTSGLDPNQIIEIREVIKKFGREKTVLFSTHILQEVEAICDRVIIINKGVLVADDKLSNLQQSQNTYDTVVVQFKEPVDRVVLQSLTGVDKVEEIQSTVFKLQTSDGEAVRRQLLQLAVHQNLNIVSLQSETHRLEDIFRVLTQRPNLEGTLK